MARATLAELTEAAAAADGPAFPAAAPPRPGGVDPLGLRQLNFDLMDQVLPGLNNVARHVRPFVLVSWAWRRAKAIADAQSAKTMRVDELRDFVDRIEVIYAWSQFLRNPDAELPGRQVLAPLVKADQWVFGGEPWRKRREERRYSTAFTAPINYGPGLKTLGWLAPHERHPDALIPSAAATPAIDAFEGLLSDRLDRPAFSRFGPVTVTAEEAARWSKAWALEEPTETEARVMAGMLFGAGAPQKRRAGGALMRAAASYVSSWNADRVRVAMAGPPSDFVPPAGLEGAFAGWRRVQVRQLFRLALEAILYWIQDQIEDAPKTTQGLVEAFLDQTADRAADGTALDWLDPARVAAAGPIELMERIRTTLANPAAVGVASAIVDGLAFSLTNAPNAGESFERDDRLPLFRARRESEAWSFGPPRDFARHVLESWVLAQHVYWSVGRGLADARAGGKTILRLKVVLDEGGWTLAPGASRSSAPVPTADRLLTALTLAHECRLLDGLSP